MDYKRNNRFFYIQGLSLPKGCYFCKLVCCCCCQCLPKSLDLKKKYKSKVPSSGENKGYTKVGDCCCCCCCGGGCDCDCKQCCDLYATYTSQEGNKYPTMRSPCFCSCCNICDCGACCCCCCCCNCCKCFNLDIELD